MKSEIIRFVTVFILLVIMTGSLTYGWIPTEPGSVEMLMVLVGHLAALTAVIITYVVSVINQCNSEVSDITRNVIAGLNSYVKTGYGIE